MNTSWKFDNSMTKDEQEVLFSNFGLFEDPQDRSPEQGPKTKFRSNNFVWVNTEKMRTPAEKQTEKFYF